MTIPEPIVVAVAKSNGNHIEVIFPPWIKRSSPLPEWAPEDIDLIADWLVRHWTPDSVCDECSKTMCEGISTQDIHGVEYGHMFFATPFGSRAFWLCEWCLEKAEAASWDDVAIPQIIAKANTPDIVPNEPLTWRVQ